MSDGAGTGPAAAGPGGTGPAGTSGWAEGQDGTVVAYEERLRPPWWLWLVVPASLAVLGIAYGSAYGTAAGLAVFFPPVLVAYAALWVTSPVVRVDDRVFRAGRARLPLAYAGPATALDATAARDARGRDADPRAFLVLRTWTTGRAVKVAVTDPEDPHPYWLVSTRRPERVVEALTRARRQA